MTNNLQLLIEELQKEQDALTHELEECIRNHFFEEAEAFEQALTHTQMKLRLLKNLEHPQFDQLEAIKRRISYMVQLLEKNPTPFTRSYAEQELARDRQQLAELEQLAFRPTEDSDKVIKCLEDMAKGKMSCFSLQFDQLRVILRVERRGSDVEISLRETKQHPLEDFFSGIRELSRMGLITDGAMAMLTIEKFGPAKVLPTLEVLSRIIFDGLGLYGGRRGVLITYPGPFAAQDH